MYRVILESPFASTTAAGIERNIRYARACMRDMIERGEAPLASHLLYTQPGVLNDAILEERRRGISAGLQWCLVADYVAVYTDLGFSRGMHEGIRFAEAAGKRIEYRTLPFGLTSIADRANVTIFTDRADPPADKSPTEYSTDQAPTPSSPASGPSE